MRPRSSWSSSTTLVPRAARIANGALGLLVIPLPLSSGIRDLDGAFFATVNVAALMTIAAAAWPWKPTDKSTSPDASHLPRSGMTD